MPAGLLRVTASRGAAGRLLDNDPATRWLSGRPQAGQDWIEVALAATTTLSGVRLLMGPRSLNDYPRGPEVAVAGEGEAWRVVHGGSVAAALGAALHRDPAAPAIELGWAPVSARRVRLRQTGGRSRWYWSVHELRLLAPAS